MCYGHFKPFSNFHGSFSCKKVFGKPDLLVDPKETIQTKIGNWVLELVTDNLLNYSLQIDGYTSVKLNDTVLTAFLCSGGAL